MQSVRAVRQRLGIPADAVVVGAVGRLESEKNYPLLIQAFRDAAAAVPGMLLLIAGDGSLRNELQRQIEACHCPASAGCSAR